MKVELTQFQQQHHLLNGQPINLNIMVARDGNYITSLQAWVSLLSAGIEELKKEMDRTVLS